ncbi:hypothetical protein [Amphibacillus marinus]|nr:hypothetical protein [Amphibacillus marinus]
MVRIAQSLDRLDYSSDQLAETIYLHVTQAIAFYLLHAECYN